MDPMNLYELCESRPEWDIIQLEDDKGIFIGNYGDFLKLISKARLGDQYYDSKREKSRSKPNTTAS
jgi:hypothetical protein